LVTSSSLTCDLDQFRLLFRHAADAAQAKPKLALVFGDARFDLPLGVRVRTLEFLDGKPELNW